MEEEKPCCSNVQPEWYTGAINLVTGMQYTELGCANCGDPWIGTHSQLTGEDLARIRRESGITEEALRKGAEAFEAVILRGRRLQLEKGVLVELGPDVLKEIPSEIYYFPKDAGSRPF